MNKLIITTIIGLISITAISAQDLASFRLEVESNRNFAVKKIGSENLWPKENQNLFFDMSRHLIFLNQSGFNTDWPKRFTAPLSPDGTLFVITSQNSDEVLLSGVINDHVGDFSDFVPPDQVMQYVVRINADDRLKDGISDPFFVAPYLMERVTMEPMLRFFVDDRSVTGSWYGGLCAAPWRDSPFYAYSTPSLIHLYLSNPSFFKQQRVEMDWARDLSRALDSIKNLS